MRTLWDSTTFFTGILRPWASEAREAQCVAHLEANEASVCGGAPPPTWARHVDSVAGRGARSAPPCFIFCSRCTPPLRSRDGGCRVGGSCVRLSCRHVAAVLGQGQSRQRDVEHLGDAPAGRASHHCRSLQRLAPFAGRPEGAESRCATPVEFAACGEWPGSMPNDTE